MIDRVVNAMRAICDDIVLSASAPDAKNWLIDVPILSDEYPGRGGLAGVHAVLRTGRDAVVVAWDMPFVSTELLGALVELGRLEDADAVVPESDSPFGVEPFCAYYSARLSEPLARFLTESGGAAAEFLARLSTVRRLPAAQVRRIGDPGKLFFSVNTPGDLERARALAGAE